MSDPDFEHFRALLRARSGLVIDVEKRYLVDSRLDAVARAHGLSSPTAVLTALRTAPSATLTQAALDAMNTHESLFFRDTLPFEQTVRRVLPELTRRKPVGAPLRIWSAACSSGQEPYSLAMILREQTIQLGGRTVDIVATDLSNVIIDKARAGLYSEFEVNRGLDDARRTRWLRRNGAQWEVRPEIKSMVSFRQHNLLAGALLPGAFDIVFCRNVLIYFDNHGKSTALRNVAASMADEGFLFLGAAETTAGLCDQFKIVQGERGLLERASPRLARALHAAQA